MLRKSLCILVSATIATPSTAATGTGANNNKNIINNNCAPFTNCMGEINNIQTDNTKDIGIVMPMYNLIECSGNYSKTYGSLWHRYEYEPFLDNCTIADFTANNNSSALFKFKTKIAGTKDVVIRVPLKTLSNFWRILEMPLINCEINLILTWSKILLTIKNQHLQ